MADRDKGRRRGMRRPAFLQMLPRLFLLVCILPRAARSHPNSVGVLPPLPASYNELQTDARSLSSVPVPTRAVRSAVGAAQTGALVLWEAAGEVLQQNWVADGWWFKRPFTLECADRGVTGERCTVTGGGAMMVLWIENTSGVAGPVVLVGLKITDGHYSTSASTSTGGMIILNSEAVLRDCEVSSNVGSSTVSTTVLSQVFYFVICHLSSLLLLTLTLPHLSTLE
jgi:hypothetical protein